MAKHRPHNDLRAEVIAFAEKTLKNEGLSALTARAIAKECGCSVGTLYNLFGDLDGIVAAINLRSVQALRSALAESLPRGESSGGEKLTAMGLAYFDFALANPHSWDALFRHKRGPDVSSDIRAETGQLTGILRGVVGENVSQLQITALWAAVHGVVDLAIYRHLGEMDDPEDGRQIIRLVIQTALKGFASSQETTT